MNAKEFSCGKRGDKTIIWLSPQYDQLIFDKFGYTPCKSRSKEGYRYRVPENTQAVRQWLTELKIQERRRKNGSHSDSGSDAPVSQSDKQSTVSDDPIDPVISDNELPATTVTQESRTPPRSPALSDHMTDSDLETDHASPPSEPVIAVNAETQTPPSQADISVDRDAVTSGTEDDDELDDLLDSIVGTESDGSDRSESGYDSSVGSESSRSSSDHDQSGSDRDDRSSVCSNPTELFMEQYTDTVKSVEKSLYKVIRHLIQNNPDDDTLRIAAYLQYVIDNKISALL